MSRNARIAVKATVKLKAYPVIAEAVERGVRYGWHRVWKYHEGGGQPDADTAVEHIVNAVTNELAEILQFGEED